MTTNNDYILARWRDAITDPPPGGWRGMILKGSGCVPTHGRYDRVWTTPNGCGTRVFKWLDITTIPAVPREAVQAAVDEMERLLETAKRSCRQNYISSFERALDVITDHTGVTPTEVPDIRPVEFRRVVVLPRKFEDDDEVTS